ncbi:hypothetical protein [Bacillus cihuensis]|uniref:hypothetical protein n=1 Tax=Bacillus cihuensis TaxID=1208599 RepID=UPI00040C5EEA|nr:hypothetical protein [Bacillus cihuensis]
MLQDTRDWYGMGYSLAMGYHYPSYGMGYSPYTSGYGHHPYGMIDYHYHHLHHHHGHHHPHHDGVIQSQSVLINMPEMMHGMKHRFL